MDVDSIFAFFLCVVLFNNFFACGYLFGTTSHGKTHDNITTNIQLVGPMCHCEYIILPRSFWMWMIFCCFFLFAFVYIGNCESIFGYAYVWMWAHSLRSVWYGFLAKSENMQITCEAQTCNIPWFNSIWFRDFLTILERKCVHFSAIFELYRFLLSDLCCGFLFYFLGLWLPPPTFPFLMLCAKLTLNVGTKYIVFIKLEKSSRRNQLAEG